MGSRIQKIAGIILALAFVALLVIMNTNILNLGNNANNKMSNSLAISDNYDLSSYDGTVVNGDSVINAIKTVGSLSTVGKLKIIVNTTLKSGTEYGFLDETSNTITGYNITDQRAETYINPLSDFDSKLDTNSNGVTKQITFTQK